MQSKKVKEKHHFKVGIMILGVAFVLSVGISFFIYQFFFFQEKDLSRFLPEKTNLFLEVDLAHHFFLQYDQDISKLLFELGYEIKADSLNKNITKGALAFIPRDNALENVLIFSVRDVQSANKFLNSFESKNYKKERSETLTSPLVAGGKIEKRSASKETIYFMFSDNNLFLAKNEAILKQIKDVIEKKEDCLFNSLNYKKTKGQNNFLFKLYFDKSFLSFIDYLKHIENFEYLLGSLDLATEAPITIEGFFDIKKKEINFHLFGFENTKQSDKEKIDDSIFKFVPTNANLAFLNRNVADSFKIFLNYGNSAKFLNSYKFFLKDFNGMFGYRFEDDILSIFSGEGLFYKVSGEDFGVIVKLKDFNQESEKKLRDFIKTSFLILNPRLEEVKLSDGTIGREYSLENEQLVFIEDKEKKIVSLSEKNDDGEKNLQGALKYMVKDDFLVIGPNLKRLPDNEGENVANFQENTKLNGEIFPFIYFNPKNSFRDIDFIIIYETLEGPDFGKIVLK